MCGANPRSDRGSPKIGALILQYSICSIYVGKRTLTHRVVLIFRTISAFIHRCLGKMYSLP